MNLYLVQHGAAVSRDVDPDRPLSAEGEAEVLRMANWLGAAGLEIPDIRHSGKTRTAQTAARLARALHPPPRVAEVAGLGPKDDIRKAAEEVSARDAPLMIVGHLPFLARLTGLLVVGDPACEVVHFRYAGVVCLERAPDGPWRVDWVLPASLAAVRLP